MITKNQNSAGLLTVKTPSLNTEDEIAHWDNPHPRCPVALLLDTSASLQGAPIAELQKCVRMFFDEIAKDDLAALRVDLTCITFGGEVKQVVPFCSTMVEVSDAPKSLTAQGNTPLGAATRAAIAAVRERRQLYKDNALPQYQPWVIIMSDGAPTDEWEGSAAELRKLAETGWNVLTIGIGDHANLRILQQFSVLQTKRIDTVHFASFFIWLSSSLRMESRGPTTQTSCTGLPAQLGSIPAI